MFSFISLRSFAEVGPSSHHYFIGDHAQSVVVDLVAMILVEHYFWGHVAGRPRGVFGVAESEVFGDAEIGQVGMAWIKDGLPCLSNTMFSGFTSRWITSFECR